MPISDSNPSMLSYFLCQYFKKYLTRVLWLQVCGAGVLELGFQATFFNEIFSKIDTCKLPWHLEVCVLYFSLHGTYPTSMKENNSLMLNIQTITMYNR